jgi:hypothetical protein
MVSDEIMKFEVFKCLIKKPGVVTIQKDCAR